MDLISAVIMLLGATFTLVATVGLHRFDDVFARMHAAGKSSTLGFILILIGIAMRLTDPGQLMEIALIGLLAAITLPAGVHVIARAAWRAGTELADATEFDEASRRRATGS